MLKGAYTGQNRESITLTHFSSKGEHNARVRFFGGRATLRERFLEILDGTNDLDFGKLVYSLCLPAADLQPHWLFSQSRAHGRSHRSSLPPLRTGHWRLG